MTTPVLAPQNATPHPEWCHTHDHEANVCLGDTIHLDFRTDGRPKYLAAWSAAGMGYCPEEGVDVFIDLPGLGAAYMTVEDAEKLGTALFALVATARRAGVR